MGGIFSFPLNVPNLFMLMVVSYTTTTMFVIGNLHLLNISSINKACKVYDLDSPLCSQQPRNRFYNSNLFSIQWAFIPVCKSLPWNVQWSLVSDIHEAVSLCTIASWMLSSKYLIVYFIVTVENGFIVESMDSIWWRYHFNLTSVKGRTYAANHHYVSCFTCSHF